MIIYLRIILTTVILVMFFTSQSQTPTKALETPVKYITPEEGISLSIDLKKRPGSFWVVFSDRKGNKTYESSTGNKIKRTVGFMDNFYVAEEEDHRVHIIKDPNYKDEGFSASSEDFGWIDKNNLLLWDHCLITKEGRINKKGMVLNTIESIKKEKIKKGTDESVKFYYDAQLTKESSKSSKIYEILYVYKVTDNAILLGKNYITDVYHAKDEIFGWVSNKKITIWDHRIAVEPNWNEAAVKERKQNNIAATFFIDKIRAKRFAEPRAVNDKFVIWSNDTFEKRNIGDWRRFPLLKYDKESQIIKAGVMGELRSALSRKDTISQVGFADIQRKYNELRAKQRNINIVFVVDGTKSMELYFPAISKAINSSMDKLTKSYSKNSLRFGAVVYTDYAEENMLTQVKKLSSNYQDIAHWLSPSRVYHKNDKDTPEAVNYGLQTALRSVGFQKNETNIIILVGDAGNHSRQDPSQINKSGIIDLLFLYDCNFLAFQVHNENHSSYDEFEPQMKDFILSTAMRKYQQNKEIAEQAKYKLSPPRFIRVSNNSFILDTTTMIGTVVLAKKGKPLSPQQLQNDIDKTVKFSSDLTDRNLKMLEAIISEGKSFDDVITDNDLGYVDNDESISSQSSYSPAIIDFLRKMGIPESKLKIILAENYQLYFPAYSPMKINGLQYPIYNQVLFITLRELGDLLTKFDALADAYTSSSQRQKLKEVWLELLQNHLGDEFSRERAENMTFEKINEKVFGLPGTSGLLNIRLDDITDPSVVSDSKFYDYIQKIKNKRIELDKIYNNKNFEFGFYSYDTQYFWISQDMLP